jgi:glycosyltransferase involved in cell wall biosynthesis
VLALVPYSLGRAPGQRYRVEQWAPYLAEAGVELEFVPFASDTLAEVLYRPGLMRAKAALMLRGLLRRMREAWSARGFDAVLVHREAALVGPAWAERVAKARQARLVYDFDDAVWVPYVSPTNRYFSYLKFPGKTRTICRLASLVLAGNEHLAEWARQYSPNVHVVPSTVSLRDYPVRPSGGGTEAPVVGWTGSHSSIEYLRAIGGALRRLRQRRPFRLVVIGVAECTIAGVDVECRPWNPATEARDLWDFDVGIMPLPDEAWARGKCGMKAIQYMAVGVPAVVSPVGANRTIVRDGVSGFHATTEDEWVEALDRALGDAELRRCLGAAARESVVAKFSAEAQAPRVAGLLKQLLADERRP